MKNAMKKIMSLVLVAMILVSALPFAASAESADAVTVVIVDNANDQDVARFDKVPSRNGESAVGDLLDYWVNGNASVESAGFVNAYAYYADNSRADVVQADKLKGGDKVRIRANIVWAEQEEEETPVAPIKVVVKVESSDNVVWTGEKVPSNGEYALVENLLSYCWNSSWANVYEYDHAWSSAQQANISKSAKVYAGDTLYIMLNEKPAETTQPTQPTQPEETKPADKVVDEEWMKDIYLYIYTNNDIIAPAKRVLLNNYLIVKDHTLNKAEILSVVDDYYKATNTNNGIIWKGAYMENANIDAINFVDGRNEVPFENLDVARSGASAVVIKVRVTGVTAITSSSNADSTNPKTGDTIMVPFAIMTVSASLLAVAFYMNKKRAF